MNPNAWRPLVASDLFNAVRARQPTGISALLPPSEVASIVIGDFPATILKDVLDNALEYETLGLTNSTEQIHTDNDSSTASPQDDEQLALDSPHRRDSGLSALEYASLKLRPNRKSQFRDPDSLALNAAINKKSRAPRIAAAIMGGYFTLVRLTGLTSHEISVAQAHSHIPAATSTKA
jgi:hypothetical protein